MKDDYGFIAPFYNLLAKMIFGNKLLEAKNCFVSEVEDKKILIIGGGDGIDHRGISKNLTGQFWEHSQGMLDLAKENLLESDLSFHLGEFRRDEKILFDEVWLHFVLDTMRDEEIASLLGEIRKSLTLEGKIYLADFFAPKSINQKILQGSMITFFRLMANHKRANLPDYEEFLLTENWEKISEKQFVDGWVKAQVWSLPVTF